MASLEDEFLKRFNAWGQSQREHHMDWHNMKFLYNKHDVEQFAYG